MQSISTQRTATRFGLAAAAATACLLLPLGASASSYFHPAATDQGFTQHTGHGSSLSRTAVQADVVAAARDGSLRIYQRSGQVPPAQPMAARDRNQVSAEGQQALQRGTLGVGDH